MNQYLESELFKKFSQFASNYAIPAIFENSASAIPVNADIYLRINRLPPVDMRLGMDKLVRSRVIMQVDVVSKIGIGKTKITKIINDLSIFFPLDVIMRLNDPTTDSGTSGTVAVQRISPVEEKPALTQGSNLVYTNYVNFDFVRKEV